MKIGVISDTHMKATSKALENLSFGAFADAAIILHAGDITRIDVLDAFAEKQVIAVCGNMDRNKVTDSLPMQQIVTVEGYRIALIHGWGSASGIEDRLLAAFTDVNAIVYGHTHIAANHIKEGVLLFNPGSFSEAFYRGSGRSVGVLTAERGVGITGEIIKI